MGKSEAAKKDKTTTDENSSTASLIFGDLAKDNFRDKDITNWRERGKTGFFFKQALGDTFFHGLDLPNSLESENSRLQQSLNNAKNSSDYYKGLLDEVNNERPLHKSALKVVQDDLEKVTSDASTADEAPKKEIEKLKAEN